MPPDLDHSLHTHSIAEILEDHDYALQRVPSAQRHHWFATAVQRFGQKSSLSQFLLGAVLGFGMPFWDAFWALTLGSVILEAVLIFVGIIGMREGLNTSVLTRWTGFGTGGSLLVGLCIGISLIGWFGIQSGVSAKGLTVLLPFFSESMWSLIFGLLVTAVAMRGFSSMQWVANVTVPLFLLLVSWSIFSALQYQSLTELMARAPDGPALSMIQGISLVTGGFIVGAIIAPDMTRYNRSVVDVVKQAVLGVTLGEYSLGLAGVLLAHAAHTPDIAHIVTTSIGWVGIFVILLGTFKINDWNLYSAGLSVVNFIDAMFAIKVNRTLVTASIGVLGSLLGALGMLNHYVNYLTWLGILFPPIGGIIVAEYFVVKKWRTQLDSAPNTLPVSAPVWVPASLVIWVLAALIGYYVPIGVPSINSIAGAFVLYVIAGRFGWIRGVGDHQTNVDQ